MSRSKKLENDYRGEDPSSPSRVFHTYTEYNQKTAMAYYVESFIVKLQNSFLTKKCV